MKTLSLGRFAGACALGLSLIVPVQASTAVGVVFKGRTSFWNAVEAGAIEAGQAADAVITVKTPPHESDIAVQIQLFNSLVAQGAKAIVLAPNSKDALAEPVAAAEAKGVKVVVVDSPVNGDHIFVGTNHNNAGTAAGKLLAGLVKESDEVSFLKHSQTSGATNLREISALAALRAVHASIVVNRDIFSGAEEGAELEKAALLLDQHPATRAVLASGTPGTLAMLKVLDQRQLAGKVKLVGFGFNLTPEVASAIERNLLQGWIAQLPRVIGAKAVQTAVKLVKGEAVSSPVECEFLVVTKDNLKDPKVQALIGE